MTAETKTVPRKAIRFFLIAMLLVTVVAGMAAWLITRPKVETEDVAKPSSFSLPSLNWLIAGLIVVVVLVALFFLAKKGGFGRRLVAVVVPMAVVGALVFWIVQAMQGPVTALAIPINTVVRAADEHYIQALPSTHVGPIQLPIEVGKGDTIAFVVEGKYTIQPNMPYVDANGYGYTPNGLGARNAPSMFTLRDAPVGGFMASLDNRFFTVGTTGVFRSNSYSRTVDIGINERNGMADYWLDNDGTPTVHFFVIRANGGSKAKTTGEAVALQMPTNFCPGYITR